MQMTAKVENYCAKTHFRSKMIVVEGGEKVCINCAWYQQHYRDNRGNLDQRIPINSGCCILLDRPRGPLCRPCRDFERK